MRAMKDSGIEWIGKIPKDWELSKIGSAYSERNTKVSDTDYKALSVTMNGIVPQLETAAKTDNGDNRKLIRINDFVINSRSDRRGSCGISPYDGSCSLINTVLIPRENMNNAYYGFLFKTSQFADDIL
jgi:type I restriction enzyme S subunit